MTEMVSDLENRDDVALETLSNVGGARSLTPETAQAAIEAAFLVPPDVFQEFWDLHHQSATIILTIPVERRAASVVLSIPRVKATQLSYYHKLPTIFTSLL
jgi:hypothetical protein